MRVSAHGKYLLQLTRLGMFNCYLVREEDGFTLVDTNLGGSATSILAAAERAGAAIVRILLTHAHSDHVGSLDALHAALPAAEVLIGAREARLLAGDMSLDADEPQTGPRGGFPRVATQPTQTLHPGDYAGSLQAIAAPGHTPGQMAFFDPRDGTLVAGDALVTKSGMAVAGVLKWSFPFPALATWHKPTALRTARALRALEPARLAVGHGPVIERPLAPLDAAIRAAERRRAFAE
ncbi:MAG: MBL fold metallo-hydrolase [Anaerolineae bacterium]|nr:MBL fold metallo-hydrolase [Anaerolineae bacterium]